MTRNRSISLAAAAFVLLGAQTAGAEELRIATLAPSGSVWMDALERGAQEVNEKTDGRIEVKYYGNGVQGDEKDVLAKIKLEQLDGGAFSSAGLSLIDSHIRVLQLPMMFQTVEEMEYVVFRMWPYFQKRFEKKGYYLGPVGYLGWIHFMTTKKVDDLDDLKKLKIWKWGDDPTSNKVFEKLGLNGVPLGVPQVLPALTSGRVDAVFNSPLGALALQWSTEIKYMGSMKLAFGIGATILRKDAAKDISEEDQKIQKKVSRSQSKKLRRIVLRDNDRAQKQLVNKGIEIVDTPDDVVEEFRKSAEKMWEMGVGELYTQAELDLVKKYLAQYRAKN
jgi:TRAP-type C4-dicarboxylate transport system substrate-binding protein